MTFFSHIWLVLPGDLQAYIATFSGLLGVFFMVATRRSGCRGVVVD
jgi:hypothetical protein